MTSRLLAKLEDFRLLPFFVLFRTHWFGVEPGEVTPGVAPGTADGRLVS
jgi:hypothetical protein